MKTWSILLALSIFLFCQCNTTKKSTELVNSTQLTIAFGSCSDQNKEQKLWDDILAEQPDVWIWLGDNIYGDSEDMQLLHQKYEQQKANPLYQQLLANTLVTGTWDDHDYGANDAGKEFPKRKESQQVFLDFLNVPKNDARRTRQGVYGSEIINSKIATVKIILLDTRFFRDNLVKKEGVNAPNWEGTILGTTQWQWLENELQTSNADVHIIASSIQVLPEDHVFEKWANFPKERERLLDLLQQYDVKNPILISGDRHIGEISVQNWKGKQLYEITSSSLTHGWSEKRKESNKHRIGTIVYKENYGIIQITKKDYITINATIKSAISSEEAALQIK